MHTKLPVRTSGSRQLRQMLSSQVSLVWKQLDSLNFHVSLLAPSLQTQTELKSNKRDNEVAAINTFQCGSRLLQDHEHRTDGNVGFYDLVMKENTSKTKSHQEDRDAVDYSKPEAVLQYERQRRKAQHLKKVGQQVSVDEHLRIVYVDESIVVANKPAGVLTVPGINGRHSSSLLSLIHDAYGYCGNKEKIYTAMDHMIVHRLDMDTSGLVVFGRSLEITKKLQEQFRSRNNVDKEYECLVMGHFRYPAVVKDDHAPISLSTGSITALVDLPLQRDHKHPPFMRVSTPKSEEEAINTVELLQKHGWKKLARKKPKPSQTIISQIMEYGYYKNEKDHQQMNSSDRNKGDVEQVSATHKNDYALHSLPYTRLRLKPITGRTHQLRVHCAALGYPIVGDPTYALHGEAAPNGGLEDIEQWYILHEAGTENGEPTLYRISDCDFSNNISTNEKRPSVKCGESSVSRNDGHIDDFPSALSTNLIISTGRCPIQMQKEWMQHYPPNDYPMCLHARILQLLHPSTGQKMRWEVPPEF